MGRKGRRPVKRSRQHFDAEPLLSGEARIATVHSNAGPKFVPSDLTIEAEQPTRAISEDPAELAVPDSDAALPQELNREPLADQESEILDDVREVHDYMVALLGRLGTDGTSHAAVADLMPRARKKYNTSAIAEQPRAESTKPESTPDRACVAAPMLTELEPRQKPPEISNLVVMRELANEHTRAAIDTHHRNFLEKSMLNNGAAGLACLIGSVVALICAPVLGETMGIGRGAAVVASVYFLHVSYVSARAWLASR